MPIIPTGFTRPTLPALITRIMGDLYSRFTGEDPRIRRSPWYAVAHAWAGLANGLYGYLDRTVRERFASTATEAWLGRIASEYGVARNPAVAANGAATFTWTAAAGNIPIGTLVVADDGTEYLTTVAIVDPGAYPGTAAGNVLASVAGAAGNLAAGATLSLSSPIAGITSDGAALAGITGGVDIEAIEDWRIRILERIRTIPHWGTAADYEADAKAVSGVTGAWADSPSPGYVRVVYTPPTPAATPTPATVLAGLDQKLSMYPLIVTQATGTASELEITGLALIDPAYVLADVQAAIVAAVEALFARVGGPSETIYNSEIRQTIGGVTGVDNYTLTDLRPLGTGAWDGTGLSDITAGATQAHTLTGITWI